MRHGRKKMATKLLFSLSILLIFFLSSNVFSEDFSFKPKYSVIIDPSKGDEVTGKDSKDQYSCFRNRPENTNGYWLLTEKDLQILEKNFKKIIQLTPTNFKKKKIENLQDYVFQYVGISIGGKKYIYINAVVEEVFRDTASSEDRDQGKKKESTHFYWEKLKHNPIMVCDGGWYFWGALFRIEDATFTELTYNHPGG